LFPQTLRAIQIQWSFSPVVFHVIFDLGERLNGVQRNHERLRLRTFLEEKWQRFNLSSHYSLLLRTTQKTYLRGRAPVDLRRADGDVHVKGADDDQRDQRGDVVLKVTFIFFIAIFFSFIVLFKDKQGKM